MFRPCLRVPSALISRARAREIERAWPAEKRLYMRRLATKWERRYQMTWYARTQCQRRRLSTPHRQRVSSPIKERA